jgi:hypothetical protein
MATAVKTRENPRLDIDSGYRPTVSPDQIELINTLDLEPIVFKLTVSEKNEPAKMTLDEADRNVALYRQFLILNLLYPNRSIVPTSGIDEVWHTHILDTAKYRDDCDRIFGRFLDHFPYLGLRGEDDERNWLEAFAETCRLYEQHFGVKLTGSGAYDSAACGNSCGGSLCDGGACDSGACDSSGFMGRERPRPIRSVVAV